MGNYDNYYKYALELQYSDGSRYYWVGKAPTPCYYCGLPANSIDHVVPQALLNRVKDDYEVWKALKARRRLTVDSCRECNSLLGSKYDHALVKRKQRLKEALIRKYINVLEIPQWNNHEIAALSGMLQQHVLQGIKKQAIVRERLRW